MVSIRVVIQFAVEENCPETNLIFFMYKVPFYIGKLEIYYKNSLTDISLIAVTL